jgi:hypothetical protein
MSNPIGLIDIATVTGGRPPAAEHQEVDVTRSVLAQRRHVDLLRTSSALCPAW